MKTFYNGIKMCVIQNGHISEYIYLERGCRQDDPISPYLFLRCAEILGIIIRNIMLHSKSKLVPLLESIIHCNTGNLWKRGSSFVFDIFKTITNPFWKEVFLCWTYVHENFSKTKMTIWYEEI